MGRDCGHCCEKSDCKPKIYCLNSTEHECLQKVIDCIRPEMKSYCPIIFKLECGVYKGFQNARSIKDLTIIGDPRSVVGAPFVDGGFYGTPPLAVVPQLSPDLGRGEITLTLSGSGYKTITLLGSEEDPDFSCLEKSDKVCLVDTAGIIYNNKIKESTGNEITLEYSLPLAAGLIHTGEDEDIYEDTVDLNVEEPRSRGMGFVIKPCVVIEWETGPVYVGGFKNLTLRGITMQKPDEEALLLGGAKTTLTISNCLSNVQLLRFSGQVHNNQPNTLCGTPGDMSMGQAAARLDFSSSSNPDIFFTGIFGRGSSVNAFGSSNGAFLGAVFCGSKFNGQDGARLSLGQSRFYNVSKNALNGVEPIILNLETEEVAIRLSGNSIVRAPKIIIKGYTASTTNADYKTMEDIGVVERTQLYSYGFNVIDHSKFISHSTDSDQAPKITHTRVGINIERDSAFIAPGMVKMWDDGLPQLDGPMSAITSIEKNLCDATFDQMARYMDGGESWRNYTNGPDGMMNSSHAAMGAKFVEQRFDLGCLPFRGTWLRRRIQNVGSASIPSQNRGSIPASDAPDYRLYATKSDLSDLADADAGNDPLIGPETYKYGIASDVQVFQYKDRFDSDIYQEGVRYRGSEFIYAIISEDSSQDEWWNPSIQSTITQ